MDGYLFEDFPKIKRSGHPGLPKQGKDGGLHPRKIKR